MTILRLAELSDNPRHQKPVDALNDALKSAKENPDFNAAYIIVAKTREVPGGYDELAVNVFSANLNDLEVGGLLALLASAPRGDGQKGIDDAS